MEEKIKDIINNLRPYLNSDGGDIEFIKYEDNIVYVKLLGACGCCPHKNIHLSQSILSSIQEEIPEVEDIICVDL